MEPKLNLMKAILGLEHYFCPKYCGIVDRRRVIGYLLFSVSEVLIILYHFILILRLGEPHGVVADVGMPFCLPVCSWLSGPRNLLLPRVSPFYIYWLLPNWLPIVYFPLCLASCPTS